MDINTTETVLRPTPGEGMLARAGDLVLLCGTAQQARSEELLGVLERVAAEGGDGRRFVRRVAAAVLAMETPPALVAYGPTSEGQALLVRGAATAVARTAEGDVRLEGADAVTWTDRVLHGSSAITASLGANPMGAVSIGARLDNGVVPAGGFALTGDDADGPIAALPEPPVADEAAPAAGTADHAEERPPSGFRPLGRAPVDVPPEPADAQEAPPHRRAKHAVPAAEMQQPPEPSPSPGPPPVPEPPPAGPPAPEGAAASSPEEPSRAQVGPHTMTDGAEAAQADGAPEVLGIHCKNEHFNHPEARSCAVCGISMVQLTHVPKPGKRPPLGVLVLDDGRTFRLDTTYIIGREPERHHEVERGHAVPVSINDPDALVSRSHAMVTLDGWNVQIVDLESANGTHILAPGATGWVLLQPNQPQTIVAGTRIAISRRGFYFESHRTY
ncbi:MAG: FHA domain-containing protein [Streptosporangiales bacterium]